MHFNAACEGSDVSLASPMSFLKPYMVFKISRFVFDALVSLVSGSCTSPWSAGVIWISLLGERRPGGSGWSGLPNASAGTCVVVFARSFLWRWAAFFVCHSSWILTIVDHNNYSKKISDAWLWRGWHLHIYWTISRRRVIVNWSKKGRASAF